MTLERILLGNCLCFLHVVFVFSRQCVALPKNEHAKQSRHKRGYEIMRINIYKPLNTGYVYSMGGPEPIVNCG